MPAEPVATRPRARLRLDPFAAVILATGLAAVLLPPSTAVAGVLKPATSVGVGLVFFLHGARLSPREVRRGLGAVRLQLAVLAMTFLVAPLLIAAAAPLIGLALGPELARGFLVVAALPSTVQSSVAFVALARGHVAAAVTAAAVSNLLGVLISPALLTLLVAGEAGGATPASEVSTEGLLGAIQGVALMVLAPFAAGQLAGPLLRPLLLRRAALATWVDRSVIAALVYQAVGQSVTSGVGDDLHPGSLVGAVGVAAGLFAILGALGLALGRALGLSREDQVVVGVCGGMKSMATGLPMLRVLFGDSPEAGLLALPLVLFHQVQLLLLSLWAGQGPHAEASRPDDGQQGPGDKRDGGPPVQPST